MVTDYAAPAAPDTLKLDRANGSATIDLYRAVLGPLRADYYLKAFTRFDAAGKSRPDWNWVAALLSLNWMLFRRLWVPALAYVGALTGAALLLLGLGRLVFGLSDDSQWLLLGLAMLLGMAVSGALGNAWLYAACNQKMERALTASATVEEACTLLTQQAPGRKRMGALTALNLTVCGLAASVVLNWPDSSALPWHTRKLEQARVSQPASQQSGLAQTALGAPSSSPMAVASTASASSPAPAAATVTSVASAPSAASRSSQGLVQAAEPVTATAATPTATSSVSAPAPVAAPIAAPVIAASAAVPAKAPAKPKAKASVAKPLAAGKALATQPATSAASASAPTTESYLINVGLFADENNARNAFTKLKDAGLPALSQPVRSSKGARTRVRVGPFETRAEAERAAETIRSLQLEALVFKP